MISTLNKKEDKVGNDLEFTRLQKKFVLDLAFISY